MITSILLRQILFLELSSANLQNILVKSLIEKLSNIIFLVFTNVMKKTSENTSELTLFISSSPYSISLIISSLQMLVYKFFDS